MTFQQTGHFGLSLALFLGRDGDLTGNAQLGGSQLERAHDGAFIALRASVHHPTQAAPNDDAAAGDNLGTGIHIAQHDHIAIIGDLAARAERALDPFGSALGQDLDRQG